MTDDPGPKEETVVTCWCHAEMTTALRFLMDQVGRFNRKLEGEACLLVQRIYIMSRYNDKRTGHGPWVGYMREGSDQRFTLIDVKGKTLVIKPD